MQFESDSLYAAIRRKFDGLFPIGNEHLVPLPFEYLGIIGRPGTSYPGRRLCVGIGAGAPGKSNDSVYSDLSRENAGGLEIRLEFFRDGLIGMYAIPVHGQSGDTHIVFLKRSEELLARFFVLA